ncbi:hypothetical protein EV421DRAFT_955376 [Armillaria borealis]|uniref:Uncharacterized protein n=1 Tax=Armillaria borealis TaxID=47425 RepID=A0AA39J9H0_9AGAR|nr:hypothetical protein EV421DRAFT_955376 [Armillaria borealis]
MMRCCGHFKIASSCPLNLGNVKSVGITIRLSNESAETNAAVAWWTSNINVIPTLNRLIAVLIELEIDMDSLSSGSTPDWNRDIWAAFDQVLCRRDINLHRLVFRVRPLWELPSEGYNYGPIMYWLCVHCLPKTRALYRSVFKLLDDLDKKVTMPWMLIRQQYTHDIRTYHASTFHNVRMNVYRQHLRCLLRITAFL